MTALAYVPKLSTQLGRSNSEEEWNPYVGPRPFRRDPDDQNRFFGRDEETEQISSLIYGHQLVLIYAQSGAGKTSLFNAQVAPELEKNGFQVLPVARVGIGFRNDTESTYKGVVDSRHSFEFNPYVLSTFQSLMPKFNDQSLLNAISLDVLLHDYFPHKINQRGKPVQQVIIFDQLEELFNIYSDPNKWYEQQQDFFKQIAEALEGDPLLRVVFIIREDYLAQLDPFVPLLPERLKPHFRLERLDRDAAFEAIKGPLEKAKAFVNDEGLITKLFDEGIIDKLTEGLLKIRVETFGGKFREVRGEYVEPIQLQVVCQNLWNKLKTSRLDQINQSYYEDLKYIDVEALKTFYIETIRDTSRQTRIKEGTIRKWFEEKLITSSGTRGIVHRGFQSTGGIPNTVVDILEKKYIIRKEERSGAQWYELTHDRFIKPILDSNKEWKDKQIRKSRRRLKILLPIAVIGAVLFTSFIYVYSPPTSHCGAGSEISMEGSSAALDSNPQTNKVYVTSYNTNRLNVIDGETCTVIKSLPVGKNPLGVAVDPSLHKVYVANNNSDTISIIDDQTNELVTVSMGRGPDAVAVDLNTSKVYVANSKDNTVSVIDPKTDTVVGKFFVGREPAFVAIDPKMQKVYVASNDRSVSVIDTKANEVLPPIPVGRGIQGLAVNTNSHRVYVTTLYPNSIYIIDGRDPPFTVINKVRVNSTAGFISFNPNMNQIYHISHFGGHLFIIDASTINKNKSDIIPVGKGPIGVTFDPKTNKIYVANLRDNTVSVIDPKTEKVVGTIKVGTLPVSVAVDPNTNKAYVANSGDNNTSVIDLKTNSVVENIPVGGKPYNLAIDPNTNNAFVANREDNTVSVIDLKTDKVVGRIHVDRGPYAIAVNPGTSKAYVANSKSGSLFVIDGMTNTVVGKPIAVGGGPEAVALDTTTNKAYVYLLT